MLIVHVYVHIKSEFVTAFREATLDNAANSVQEPGVVRFDVIQQQDDPTRFVLMEVYRDTEAIAAHKQTDHYARWAAAVADMLAEPRTRQMYSPVFPEPEGWEMIDEF